jgi:hypothetical protein
VGKQHWTRRLSDVVIVQRTRLGQSALAILTVAPRPATPLGFWSLRDGFTGIARDLLERGVNRDAGFPATGSRGDHERGVSLIVLGADRLKTETRDGT